MAIPEKFEVTEGVNQKTPPCDTCEKTCKQDPKYVWLPSKCPDLVARIKNNFKCVYCNMLIPYEGACPKCGHKEDVALGKKEDIYTNRIDTAGNAIL